MMMTLRMSDMVIYSFFDWSRLQRCATLFDVDTELDTLASMPIDERITVFAKGLGESFEGQTVGSLATLSLGANETLIDRKPLFALVGRSDGARHDLGRHGAHHRFLVFIVGSRGAKARKRRRSDATRSGCADLR